MGNENLSSLTGSEIVQRLEEPVEDRRPLKFKLQREAHIKELIRALQITQNELTRRILCDILGARKAKTAVPELLNCLDDPSQWVKDDAAEALGKIGSIKAGESLLNHLKSDPCFWFAVALGAIGYRPAIPSLIDALTSPYALVRGGAAWSLGDMMVYEAEDSLKNALIIENDEFALTRIRTALHQIRGESET